MEKVEIAWAAGLFEGEGCCTIFEQKHHVLPFIRLQVLMTDRDVVERFCRIVECGKVSGERRFGREHHKPTYVWQIGNRKDVERILLMFLPWLGERRRAKAEIALAEIRKLDRVCHTCGADFRAHRDDQKCCSRKCNQRRQYLKRRPVERPSQVGRPRVLEALPGG